MTGLRSSPVCDPGIGVRSSKNGKSITPTSLEHSYEIPNSFVTDIVISKFFARASESISEAGIVNVKFLLSDETS